MVDSKLCRKKSVLLSIQKHVPLQSFLQKKKKKNSSDCWVEKKVEANGSEGALFSRVTVT